MAVLDDLKRHNIFIDRHDVLLSVVYKFSCLVFFYMMERRHDLINGTDFRK